MDLKFAALIPCYNEELTIAKVINNFKKGVPNALIYVFDNNSTDNTAKIARTLGAIVISEKRQGKGYVIQSMFSKIDSDIYIIVDGDDTYDLLHLNKMIEMVIHDEADMVVGNRLKSYKANSFRQFHTFGNILVRSLINTLFKSNLVDIMSGLRVMNKEFVKNINIMSSGFEVETEMTIKALKYGYVIKELDIVYNERQPGSFSKLNTIKDGIRVLKTIFIIFKNYKPLFFFSILSTGFLVISLFSGSVVIDEYIRSRFIKRVPLAIFAAGSMILSIIFFVTGIILDSINKRFDELLNFMRK